LSFRRPGNKEKALPIGSSAFFFFYNYFKPAAQAETSRPSVCK